MTIYPNCSSKAPHVERISNGNSQGSSSWSPFRVSEGLDYPISNSLLQSYNSRVPRSLRALMYNTLRELRFTALKRACKLLEPIKTSAIRAADYLHILLLWLPTPVSLWKRNLVLQVARLTNDEFNRSGPVFVVASGKSTVPVAAAVKELTESKSIVIQILHPRCSSAHFDVIVCPSHDPGILGDVRCFPRASHSRFTELFCRR